MTSGTGARIIGKTEKSTIIRYPVIYDAMKTKKSLTITLLSVATALAILSPSALAASSQPLSLAGGGVIMNSGNQHYVIQGGQLVSGEFLGTPISSGRASFSLSADVNGLTTTGSASFSGPNGKSQLSMNVAIVDEVPAQTFPLDLTNPPTYNCQTGCTSEVPFFFVGFASLSVSGSASTTIPVVIESAYWNPFGGPIIIASADALTNSPDTLPALLLVVTYNIATIDWSNVQLAGTIGGTLGSEVVTGSYATVTTSHENLFSGVEHDSGQISLFGMSDGALNVAGPLNGHTSFSLAGSVDCSYLTGVPGTCVLTGASSSGSFQMSGAAGLKVHGTFATDWSVPSLTTVTTVKAQVT